jgi:hypothetical protein
MLVHEPTDNTRCSSIAASQLTSVQLSPELGGGTSDVPLYSGGCCVACVHLGAQSLELF